MCVHLVENYGTNEGNLAFSLTEILYEIVKNLVSFPGNDYISMTEVNIL